LRLLAVRLLGSSCVSLSGVPWFSSVSAEVRPFLRLDAVNVVTSCCVHNLQTFITCKFTALSYLSLWCYVMCSCITFIHA
jgi:hypothetical protein